MLNARAVSWQDKAEGQCNTWKCILGDERRGMIILCSLLMHVVLSTFCFCGMIQQEQGGMHESKDSARSESSCRCSMAAYSMLHCLNRTRVF